VDAEPEIVRVNYRAMNDRFIRSFPLPEGLSKQTCAPPEIVQVVGDGEVAEEFSYASMHPPGEEPEVLEDAETLDDVVPFTRQRSVAFDDDAQTVAFTVPSSRRLSFPGT
jgi:hypothetical protein